MKQKSRIRVIWCILFVVYLAVLIYLLLFAKLMGREQIGRTYSYNLELFKEIKRFLNNTGTLGIRSVLLNLVGNVIGFMPLGFLLPLAFSRVRGIIFMTLISFTTTLVIETCQLVSCTGSFDVDDLLLNTIGGILGYLIYILLEKGITAWKER
ncbi:MAG TPA: VanZ family protein [Candidatus Fimimorpha faecalis]|uniref:VanZ family protein n=1 Tax=Candidatus Fimimorpha faecalis TaxID=2840824 RepID=A0A9D1ECA6_9FIRM|nr:VanZ family protein [Candidatus Fimimorpha faecalis]